MSDIKVSPTDMLYSFPAKISSLQAHITAVLAPGPTTTPVPTITTTSFTHPVFILPSLFKSLKLNNIHTAVPANTRISSHFKNNPGSAAGLPTPLTQSQIPPKKSCESGIGDTKKT